MKALVVKVPAPWEMAQHSDGKQYVVTSTIKVAILKRDLAFLVKASLKTDREIMFSDQQTLWLKFSTDISHIHPWDVVDAPLAGYVVNQIPGE